MSKTSITSYVDEDGREWTVVKAEDLSLVGRRRPRRPASERPVDDEPKPVITLADIEASRLLHQQEQLKRRVG